MIDPKTKRVIDLYIDEAIKNKSSEQDFAWEWHEETNPALQKEILTYVRGKSLRYRVINLGWGFRVSFTVGFYANQVEGPIQLCEKNLSPENLSKINFV